PLPCDLAAKLRLRLVAKAEQPVAELERRDAVLLVVLGDLVEDALLARLDPLLVGDDRLAALGHSRVALLHVEGLDLLDSVARLRDPDALLDDLVEVDQHTLAQEVV